MIPIPPSTSTKTLFPSSGFIATLNSVLTVVPIPTLFCNSVSCVTFKLVNVDNPLVAFTLPVTFPVKFALKLLTESVPAVNVPVTALSPTTLRLPPTKELLVTVEVPTTCKVLTGCVFPIPNDPP